LFKAEEFDDGKIDGWVETETAFVRADGLVELNTESTVDALDALIVDPGNAENDT
jgi:hypothetical protein